MWRKLGIGPGEERVFAWGAVALFLLGWTDVSLRNVSETFFLKRVGVEWLPVVFLANSLLLVATTWAIGRVAARRDRLRLLPQTMTVLALLLLPIWLLVAVGFTSAFQLLVIVSKQITSITLLLFWMAMGDLLHGRQAKRLFAPMMGGVTLGAILGSFASEPLGRWLGIAGLLPISAATLALAAVATLPLRDLRPRLDARVRGPAAPREAESAPRRDSVRAIWRESGLFRILFATALCSGVLGPMLYFQFQYVADLATAGEGGEQRLLAFYAQFRGWISVGVLLAQLLVAGSLFQRVGVPLAAALSPVVYLLGFLGLSFRLSLPAGVGAMAGTKLQDSAVQDPALRILYNLFPEEIRPRATAIFEGPVKRGGGALGNLIVMIAALLLGSAPWVGYAALPIAGVWLVAALLLWRRYPKLLLAASASRGGRRDALDTAAFLDPATVRALVPETCSEDPERARLAVELLAELPPEKAAPALAEAVARAPEANRPRVVAALDRVLEGTISDPIDSPEAARRLEALLDQPGQLSARDRADLVQAYGRLMGGDEAEPLLERELADPSPAVRLAALAALERRGAAPEGAAPLDRALADALRGDEAAARRTAREEYRALLVCDDAPGPWQERLEQLAGALVNGHDRAETAEALADVAARHGERTARVSGAVLELLDDEDPRVRTALLRYVGYAGLVEQAPWLLEHVGCDREEWDAAAREGLQALGPTSSDLLLRELSFGRRSRRVPLLELIRELDVQSETLRSLYERELDRVEMDLQALHALADRAAFALLHQRLVERVGEGLQVALMLLSATRREDRIAELGERLRQARGGRRQYAIVLEALEATLPSEEKLRLVRLLEDPDLAAATRWAARNAETPGVDEVLRQLRKDPEELTRAVAIGLSVAAGFELEDHDGVDAVEKVLHLKQLPIFEELTVRQLMDLARVVKERTLGGGEVVVHQGDHDDRLYLVVEGVVHIKRGDTMLAEIGPGGFFGEIALFEGIARTATAITSSRVRLLDLDRRDLIPLMEEMPGIAISLLQTMSRRVRELTDRLLV